MAATRTVPRPAPRTGRATVRREADLSAALGGTLDAIARRRPRPWLGLLGVPLALTAALASGLWWCLLPLGLCAWWWAPRRRGWEWLAALQLGMVGAAWTTIGAVSLGTWPEHRSVIAAAWIASALALAAGGAVGRRGKGER